MSRDGDLARTQRPPLTCQSKICRTTAASSSQMTRRAGRPVRSGDLAVAEGHLAGDDRALAGPPELPATVALHDLGPARTRQPRLGSGPSAGPGGRRPGPPSQKDHRDPETARARRGRSSGGRSCRAKRSGQRATTASMSPVAAASRTRSSPGRSRLVPEYPSSVQVISTAQPSWPPGPARRRAASR